MPTGPPDSLLPSGFLKLDLYMEFLTTAGSALGHQLAVHLGTPLVAVAHSDP